MAEKGFDIQDILAEKGAVLSVPSIQKPGQVQLSKENVFENRTNHERAIRRVKGWHIFDQEIPLSLYSSVNQI